MAQEESPEIKELRSEMRKGRIPLIEAIRSAYKPYLNCHEVLGAEKC